MIFTPEQRKTIGEWILAYFLGLAFIACSAFIYKLINH